MEGEGCAEPQHSRAALCVGFLIPHSDERGRAESSEG